MKAQPIVVVGPTQTQYKLWLLQTQSPSPPLLFVRV